MLFALAYPTFAPASITRTPGQRRRTAAAVPSGEALSTINVSWSTDGGCSESDARQPSIWLAELYVTMTIERRGISARNEYVQHLLRTRMP